MKKIALLIALVISVSANANEKKVIKGKSGNEYEPIIGADGKPSELTLKGVASRFLSKMDVEDSPLLKELSPFGIQIDQGGYLWVAHVSESIWKEKKAKGRGYIELSCTGVVKQRVLAKGADYTVLHCKHGKQSSSWLPF